MGSKICLIQCCCREQGTQGPWPWVSGTQVSISSAHRAPTVTFNQRGGRNLLRCTGQWKERLHFFSMSPQDQGLAKSKEIIESLQSKPFFFFYQFWDCIESLLDPWSWSCHIDPSLFQGNNWTLSLPILKAGTEVEKCIDGSRLYLRSSFHVQPGITQGAKCTASKFPCKGRDLCPMSWIYLRTTDFPRYLLQFSLAVLDSRFWKFLRLFGLNFS